MNVRKNQTVINLKFRKVYLFIYNCSGSEFRILQNFHCQMNQNIVKYYGPV